MRLSRRLYQIHEKQTHCVPSASVACGLLLRSTIPVYLHTTQSELPVFWALEDSATCLAGAFKLTHCPGHREYVRNFARVVEAQRLIIVLSSKAASTTWDGGDRRGCGTQRNLVTRFAGRPIAHHYGGRC
jgi:hypothetical protein